MITFYTVREIYYRYKESKDRISENLVVLAETQDGTESSDWVVVVISFVTVSS